METVNIIMAALFLLVILFIITQIVMRPIKLLWKIILNSTIGLALLLGFNYLGNFYDFNLPINIVTVLITGFMGVPGILLLVCFQLLLR